MRFPWFGAVVLLALAAGGCWPDGTVEVSDYQAPPAPSDGLVDDELSSRVPKFDPARVDSRLKDGRRVNLSGSVLRLDVPMVLPDLEPGLTQIHRSYAEAIAAKRDNAWGWRFLLPSVNLLDAKAKQFDDGLVAALHLASFEGRLARGPRPVELVERILEKVDPSSPASRFLAAGLELAGRKREGPFAVEASRIAALFLADRSRSKPIGVYTWTEPLGRSFRFARYFQEPLGGSDQGIAAAIGKVLQSDPALLADYRKILDFQSHLTNPPDLGSIADLADHPGSGPVALFPASASRETTLFRRLFPDGVPGSASLMNELVARIRSGNVDLRPGDRSGWYDYQVHALETLLLPEKAEEREHLLLSASYKRRRLEAFEALVTKRRETQARDLAEAKSEAPPMSPLDPRLRVEPCPSVYLRTARAYGYLAGFLEETLGNDQLAQLRGLREGGERPMDLKAELDAVRELFFGLALVSAEDLGLAAFCLDPDGVDPDRCRQAALTWLSHYATDPDLAADTRVAIPVYVDARRGQSRIWATLGVRLVKLDARYVRPPSVREESNADWQPLEPHLLLPGSYVIAVDEFAEVARPRLEPLDRDELRKICDQARTRAAIVEALRK